MEDRQPILIAYDGSDAAREAVREAGTLFAPRPALVLTVWEPALAEFMLVPDPTGMGSTMMPYDPAIARDLERSSEEHARKLAEDGVRVARAAGLDARAILAEDETAEAADAIVAAAEANRVCAIVIGSRGLRGLRSKLLGSTSSHVLRHAQRPVVVVRHSEDRATQA